jgi:hydroxypyruvate isomerase
MPKFAVNLTMLFQEAPFLERFSKARAAGFNYVEYLFPYQWDAKILSQKLLENNLQQVLFNLPAGNWERGDRGIACIPDRKKEFKQGLELAVRYARALKLPLS